LKLVYSDYGIEIEFEENKVQVVVVESPVIYSALLRDLWAQLNGDLGGFILSERDKEYKLSQRAEGIFNPFAVNANNKKILTKLYQELKDLANEQLPDKTSLFNATLIEYLDNIVNLVPYHLKYEMTPDVSALFKVYDIGIDTDDGSMLNVLVDYIRALRQICHIDILFLVGIKNYLSEAELLQLYEAAAYEKMYLILFESSDRRLLEYERKLIIDSDCCIIKLE